MTDPALIICETVFCDTETDETILWLYYGRLYSLLRSVSDQRNSNGWRLLYLVYVSRDKSEFATRLSQIASEFSNDFLSIKIVGYDHPPEGYGYDAGAHIDQVKNPNRLAKWRKRLFPNNLVDGHPWFSNAQVVIRTVVDDDDYFTPYHFDQLADLAASDHEIYAYGIRDGYIALITDGPATLQQVKFNIAPVGCKAIAFRNRETAKTLSAWAIPDRIDEIEHKLFADHHGGYLSLVDTGSPTWVYMRRGQNLSSQNKDQFVDELCAVTEFANEGELLRHLDGSTRNDVRPVECTKPAALAVRVERRNRAIHVRTNWAMVARHGDLVAYYLLQDGAQIQQLSYSLDLQTRRFEDVPDDGRYQVKAFLKRNGDIIQTALSRIISTNQ